MSNIISLYDMFIAKGLKFFIERNKFNMTLYFEF